MYGRFANAYLNKTFRTPSTGVGFKMQNGTSILLRLVRLVRFVQKTCDSLSFSVILQNNQPKNPRNSLESKVNANPCATYLLLGCGHLKGILQSIFLVFHPQKVLF